MNWATSVSGLPFINPANRHVPNDKVIALYKKDLLDIYVFSICPLFQLLQIHLEELIKVFIVYIGLQLAFYSQLIGVFICNFDRHVRNVHNTL